MLSHTFQSIIYVIFCTGGEKTSKCGKLKIHQLGEIVRPRGICTVLYTASTPPNALEKFSTFIITSSIL